jgi:hypothetical protein
LGGGGRPRSTEKANRGLAFATLDGVRKRTPQETARPAKLCCAPLIWLGLADYFRFAFRFFFFAAFFFDVLRAAFFAAILRTVVAFFLLFGI